MYKIIVLSVLNYVYFLNQYNLGTNLLENVDSVYFKNRAKITICLCFITVLIVVVLIGWSDIHVSLCSHIWLCFVLMTMCSILCSCSVLMHILF